MCNDFMKNTALETLGTLLLQCPPVVEEHETLTSHSGVASAFTAGLLAELNLNTSTPDAFRAPPAPLPYDVVLGCQRSSNSESFRETISSGSFETLATYEDLEDPDCKALPSSLPLSPKKPEISEASENAVSASEEEDACPICPEEYDSQNPRFLTKCEHPLKARQLSGLQLHVSFVSQLLSRVFSQTLFNIGLD
ncbi:probable E3 ubiquitin-protein ligase RHB1A [Mercurialis annua]|uniref:probable E3 ubiquitin-protein ligase RHB1A n=1 Tax=Mercurialis annua TaxID=3986 RepID=UPI0024AD4F89|nr:probable E3 ubiquitin-protein ligase RHB1A [Mercurialis annua]